MEHRVIKLNESMIRRMVREVVDNIFFGEGDESEKDEAERLME